MASLPTNDYIDQLALQAEEGDDASLEELGRIAEKLGRRANQQLRRLEKAGKTGDAYKRVMEDLGGRKRFSQSRTGSAEGLRRNVEKALSALRRKEITLKGIKEVDQKTAESVFSHFGKLPAGGLSQKQVQSFNRFLENKAWPEIKRTFGSDALRAIADMVLNNDDMEDMLQEFTEWAEMPEEERDNIFDMLDQYLEF